MMVENQYGCIMADAMGLGKVSRYLHWEPTSLNSLHSDSPMHCSHVDPPQTISSRSKADDQEVHHCMSLEFG